LRVKYSGNGLGVKENMTTGNWGREKGAQYGGPNVGHGPMC